VDFGEHPDVIPLPLLEAHSVGDRLGVEGGAQFVAEGQDPQRLVQVVAESEAEGEHPPGSHEDSGLLEELRARAHEQSRTEGELLEEIVRTYLVLAPRRSDSLGAFLENLERRRREEGVEPLSEEEAMSLANEELHAMRRERREAW
jgi:hypothetical protein